ncbi:MAG: biosynthetic peptidoglycan transglycosylase, partial [Acidimicrobiales bacterium]
TALVLVAAGGAYAALPSVANAPARAAAVLSAHGGQATPSPPPARVSAALVAAEDHEYYSPAGVDIAYGVARLVADDVRYGGDQGGATLAQQLAKMLYTGPASGPTNEAEQVGLALKLELAYSRPELLRLYLDAAYFGDGAWGVVSASHHYFGLPPGQLSWAQAALLAGLVQAPSAYDPLEHPAAARARRGEVLRQLVETHVLTPARAAAAAAAPLGLHPAP